MSDVADINALLGESPIDWDAVKTIYVDGKNSVKSDGSVRTIAGFASNDGRSEAIWDDFTSYYGDQKWLDTFAPQGPWIVTRDDIPNPQALDISTYVNGERKQFNNTGQMLYQVAQQIEYISAIITLEPGDLISTGTISGVGNTTGTYLKAGDKVESLD